MITDTANHQMVSVEVKNNNFVDAMIVVIRPVAAMTRAEALLHAAWLVALAEVEEGEFQKVLEAVQNT